MLTKPMVEMKVGVRCRSVGCAPCDFLCSNWLVFWCVPGTRYWTSCRAARRETINSHLSESEALLAALSFALAEHEASAASVATRAPNKWQAHDQCSFAGRAARLSQL